MTLNIIKSFMDVDPSIIKIMTESSASLEMFIIIAMRSKDLIDAADSTMFNGLFDLIDTVYDKVLGYVSDMIYIDKFALVRNPYNFTRTNDPFIFFTNIFLESDLNIIERFDTVSDGISYFNRIHITVSKHDV